MLAGTCLLLPKCSLVWEKQKPVLLKIHSYEDGVTLWTRMQPFGKNGGVKFKRERDLTSCSVEHTWVTETTILHFQKNLLSRVFSGTGDCPCPESGTTTLPELWQEGGIHVQNCTREPLQVKNTPLTIRPNTCVHLGAKSAWETSHCPKQRCDLNSVLCTNHLSFFKLLTISKAVT